MLRDLHIKNLAVLEEASVELGEGFNVFSGETGAGKSIIVDGLALLVGVRASSDLIRTGAETLQVVGYFTPAGDSWRALLADAGVEVAGEELVVRREIGRSGRSRVFIDDQPVTLRLLTELAPSLLRIHGQREELGLVDPDLQRHWLDRCGGSEVETLLAEVRAAFTRFRELDDRLEKLRGQDRLRFERLDLLRFQLNELDSARPEAGEEERLRAERDVLRHAGAIQEALQKTTDLLFENEPCGYSALTQAAQALAAVAGWEKAAGEWQAEIDELCIRLKEIEAPLRRRGLLVEADPSRLDAVEERLALLDRLFRKYAPTTFELIALREKLEIELSELDDAEGKSEELERRREVARLDLARASAALHDARRRSAQVLEEKVMRDLAELALDKAIFKVEVELRESKNGALEIAGRRVEAGALGSDSVVYLFSSNPGEEPRPLAKVASGGELSRLYLAVQLASRGASAAAGVVTLVFDEVDSGISGAEAAILGAKLRRLAEGGQVLAVTHLPQVASCADHHFKVQKAVRDGRTFTAVEALAAPRRVEEVARMLAGSQVTEASRRHAQELIRTANDG
jgi:DNA repair protein RecN (Recombination protein N)